MNSRLQALLLSQGGVCTAGNARSCEVEEAALAAAIRQGRLVRVRRDAFVDGGLWAAADPEERLVLRTKAILLGRPGAVVSHQAALAVHQLPLWAVARDRVDLMVATSRVRSRSGVRLHPPLDVAPVTVRGCRVLPAATAAAQVALEAGVGAGLVPLDAALHLRRCTIEDVAEAFDRVATTPLRRRVAQQVLALADPACESPGETRTRMLLHDLGHSYESQVDITDQDGRFLGRVDFVVRGRAVLEFDGAVKYEGHEGRAALAAEKRREDAVRRRGYGVGRVVWADLDSPRRFAEVVQTALASSTRPGSPGRAGKP